MRLKMIIVISFLALLLIISIGIHPNSVAYAEALLQSATRLDGLNIYFSEANGEASRYDRTDNGISRFAGLLRQLGANLYTLDWKTRFPWDADLVIIAGPMADIGPDQTARLWSYVTNGGHLLLLANPIVETTSSAALKVDGGLFQLMWNDMGLRGRNDVVATERTNQPANANATEEVQAVPQAGLVANFTTGDFDIAHPITADLDAALAFSLSRSIEFDASLRDMNTTPLIYSDSNFYGEGDYATYLKDGSFQYNVGVDTGRGPLALAVAFDDPKAGTRIVLIGDRQFITNGAGFQTSPPGSASFVNPANVRFTINAVTWLLNMEQITLSLPTPGPTSTPSITPSPTLSPTPTPAAATATPSS